MYPGLIDLVPVPYPRRGGFRYRSTVGSIGFFYPRYSILSAADTGGGGGGHITDGNAMHGRFYLLVLVLKKGPPTPVLSRGVVAKRG